MKTKLLILLLVAFTIIAACCSCDLTAEETEQVIINLSKVDTVLVVTVSGLLDMAVHSKVPEITEEAGYHLHLHLIGHEDGTVEPHNWVRHNADIVAGDSNQTDLSKKISLLTEANELAGINVSRMSLLVVGKSAGAVLAWVTFMNHEYVFSDFRRVALVLIDPHGAAIGDDTSGTHNENRPLFWPDSYPINTEHFRVYHIFQHEDSPTGAAFKKLVSDKWVTEEKVCQNKKLTGSDIDHNYMVQQDESIAMIEEAFIFAWYGEEWWCKENPCQYDD